MNRKSLALYGLKWSAFSPEVPTETLYISRHIEWFCWRVENLVREGGFALVTAQPGVGKSVALRILAERLGAQQNVQVGILSRPQAAPNRTSKICGSQFVRSLSAAPISFRCSRVDQVAVRIKSAQKS
jgi:type II secretory pathway predicted ATPase ExeA